MECIYLKCAARFLDLVHDTWKSELTMERVFLDLHRGPKFDRTTHGRAIVQKLFETAWAEAHAGAPPKPVLVDRINTLLELVPLVNGDFNTFTQIAPNLVDCYFDVDHAALQAEYKNLSESFAARTDLPNPFIEKRPKVKVSSATHTIEQVRHYAYACSFLRAYDILTSADFPNLSHRITPYGKTPAFSDSANFCQLPAVGDRYYHPSSLWWSPSLQQGFASWGAQPDDILTMVTLEDGSIEFPQLPKGYNVFKSESGGSMLLYAMTARKTAWEVWKLWAASNKLTSPAWILPRVNSVQVVGPADLSRTMSELSNAHSWMLWTADQRPEVLKED